MKEMVQFEVLQKNFDLGQIENALITASKGDRNILSMTFATENPAECVSTLPIPEGYDATSRPWFKDAVAKIDTLVGILFRRFLMRLKIRKDNLVC